MTETEKILTGIIYAQSKQIEAQSKQIDAQSKQIDSLSSNIKKLLAQVKQLTALKEAKKSEKGRTRSNSKSSSSRGLEPKTKEKSTGKKASSNNFSFPKNIPVEEVRIDLPDDEKFDPITGKPFQFVREERYEYLMYEKVYKKLVVIRPVYGMGAELGMARMDLPESLLGNCKAHASLLAQIMVQRFLEHLPFYRQVEIFGRDGFSISRQALHGWYYELAEELKPLYELLRVWILKQNSIHVDETFAKRQLKGKDKLQQVYFWFISAYAGEFSRQNTASAKDAVCPDSQAVFLQYFENRQEKNAVEVLGDYNGKVHSDCYGAYEKAAKKEQFTWQICLVHCRRKFIKLTGHPLADKMIKLLGEIIHEDNKLMPLAPEERLRRRKSQIKPKLKSVIAELKKKRNRLEVDSNKALSEAFDYLLKREKYAQNFIEHADLCADNNRAERAIRPVKTGQRNWLFVGSEKGGEASAIMYSLLLTCKNLGINPQKWLTDVILNMPYTKPEDYPSLLPMNWQPRLGVLPECYKN